LIICGGNGTRLWPVSRTQSPKQFQKVGEADSRTFFQSAVERHRGEGYEAPVIVSALRHRDTIAAQLAEINVKADVIHEPMGRNTGPAVLAAAFELVARDPQALMVVVPADHVIDGDLNSTIMAMRAPAAGGKIITFGIKPRYAETGFGYITDGGPDFDYPGLRTVERFVEKPPTRKARLLVESNIAYWASGISMFAAATIIEEYRKFDPATVSAVELAVEQGVRAADGLELNADLFGMAVSAPTESMVFEKTNQIALAPLDVNWSDVGSWTAMYGISKSNEEGNVLQGDVIAVETTNSMVRSTSRLVTVVGMKDVIVIDTPDALLVTRVGHCQSVKKVAEYLKGHQRSEAEKHAVIARPVADKSAALFQSEGVVITTARIAAGGSLDLGDTGHREVLVARGELILSTAQSFSLLQAGQRLDVENSVATMLYNPSQSETEVVLLTLHHQEVTVTPQADTAHPRALYA
jgi:mannose-1-phosphate guanylyltransferase/mannose-6-phosphate isomerase